MIAVWISAGSAHGLQAQHPAPASSPGPASVVLADELELSRFTQMVAERLKLNLEYDPSLLTGSVSIRTEQGLSDSELWQLFNGVLATRSLTTVLSPSQGTYRIVKLSDAAVVAPVAPQGLTPLSTSLTPGFLSVVVRTNHRPAADLVEPLSKIILKPSGSVAALGGPGSSLLLISDLASRVEQAAALLSLIDTPLESVVVEEVPVRNITGEQLATTFAQVVAKRDAVAGQPGVSQAATRARGDVLPGPDGNTVLLVSPPSEVERWKALITSLDRRERIETVTYTPRYYAVTDVAPLIEQSVKIPTDERWKVVVDQLTGSLLITATPSQHASIQSLLDRLDDAPAAARRPVRTFVIRNRSVAEIRAILEDLLQSGVLDAAAQDVTSSTSGDARSSAPGSSDGDSSDARTDIMAMPPPPRQDGSPSGVTPVAGTATSTSRATGSPGSRRNNTGTSGSSISGAIDDRSLVFSIDEGTNTLIAVGEPRLLAQVESLLASLDVRQPQVMLEVLIVTLTDGQTLDLGVELEHLRVSGETRIRLASLFGLSTRSADGSVSTGAAQGFSGVALNPGDFSVVVRALETINGGRAFSMPKLLVGNNQQASLDSVVQQPYASVNASNTVSTTSFGGTQDAGTTVTIKPQIAEGDHLVLDYSVSLSAFLGSASQATLPPARQQNRVSSAATIPDGHTVVVGGIDLENDSKTVSQIPFIGSVPIIGEAFKNRSKTGNRTRFYVFIRANILRGSGFEDLKYLSTQEVTEAGLDPGWPTSTPRVIR